MSTINTTHPATLTFLSTTLEKGQTHVTLGISNGMPARLEISRHRKHGIVAQIFVGENDQHPKTIAGLTLEQADAIEWAFVKLA